MIKRNLNKRKYINDLVEKIVNEYFDCGGGWASSVGLSQELNRIMDEYWGWDEENRINREREKY